MDSRKSKKHRSYADPPKETNAAASGRPPLQDRAHSASVVTNRRQSSSKSHDSSKQSSPSDRDSRGSKKDDPPFSSYQTPRLTENEKLKAIQSVKSREDAGGQRLLPQVNLVVLGTPKVGKSTFVQRALDLKQPPLSPITSKKMSLDGVIYLVKLLEVPLDEVGIVDNSRIAWPDAAGDSPMPTVDGVLALFDVSDSESIADVPEVLKVLSNSSVPCVLVSCKCDVPAHSWQIETGTIERLSRNCGGLDMYQTSINIVDSQKKCISIILRSILTKIPVKSFHPWPIRNAAFHFSAPVLFKALFPHANRLSAYCTPAREVILNLVNAEMLTHIASLPEHTQFGIPCSNQEMTSLTSKVVDSPRPRVSASPRRRAATGAKPPSSPIVTRETSDSRSHTRAKSDVQRASSREVDDRDPPPEPNYDDKGTEGYAKSRTSNSSKASLRVQTAPSSRRNSRPSQPQTPRSTNLKLDADVRNPVPIADQDDTPPQSPVVSKRVSVAPSIKSLSAFNSFLNMEDEESVHEVEVPSSPDTGKAKVLEKFTETGFSFEELVDRLLAQPMSKQDAKFAAIFLCLYRKFAAPHRLLSSIITRFNALERPGAPQLGKVGEQFRYLNTLGQWVADYPGDFAHASTRQKMANFMRKLERSRVFSYAAKEMRTCVESVVEDDDTGWACHDTNAAPSEEANSLLDRSSEEDFGKEDGVDAHDEAAELSPQSSAAPSYTSVPGKSGSTSNNSSSMLFTAETAQREAQALYPVPRYSLNKTLWRQFMEIPEEDFAKELTRMDWIMYCSIRPRDFIRHVGLSGDETLKTKSLQNVNHMIAQFNRLAYFITNIILLRDKPKHRAQALAKCKTIAWKLRQLNNYNSLGAMVASISGTAVNRLAQTRDLVEANVKKEFMRLEILMNPRRSYSAYRLAWENSFAERIPFVPLHRRDLVSAEEGSKTWIGENGDRINWKKFEIMGEVVIGIQKSQGTPYAVINKNEEIKRLFLETKFTEDEEELYERSVQLEPPGAGEARKKFAFLRSGY